MADKKISELNVASTIADSDDLPLVQAAETKQVNASTIKTYVNTAPAIVGGTIDNAVIGASTQAAGAFTSLTSSSTTTLNGTTIPASKTLLVTTDIGTSVQAYDSDLTAWAGKTAPTGVAVGTSDTQTLTNKTISGSSNTLSNIANASLTNSSITINGSAVSLGGSATVTASTTNALTIGTGLSGTSFNGGSAVTIAIDSTVATLTGTQTLTNKTISGASNTLSNIGNASLTNSSITFGSTATSLGGTVSALNGVSVGATTASTGAFTTLSASSTVSGTGFSTYLASPPAIGGTTPAAGSFTTLSTTGNVTLGDASGDTVTINGTAVSIPNNLNFDSNTLFIDAANNAVGVGTSSPQSLLNTAATGQIQIGTASWPATFVGKSNARTLIGNEGILIVWNEAAAAANNLASILIGPKGSGTNGSTTIAGGAIHGASEDGSTNKGYLRFDTNGGGGNGERMRLDSSGNLGLGVTPSGWGYTALQIKSGSVYEHSSSDFRMLQNAYYASGNAPKYINTAAASMYRQESGTHYWYTAPSGTAGNAISFTQAMTLDASGNLALGATSVTANHRFTLKAPTANYCQVSLIGGDTANYCTFGTLNDSNTFFISQNGTERLRIDSSGNVGIGTSSPGYKLDVAGPIRAYNSDNWNYSNLNLVRNATNTTTPRFLSFMLNGDDNASTTIGGYPAIWGIYSGTPTTGSTSSGLSAKMGLASYAGFNFYINGTQAMTLDSAGRLIVGDTSALNSARLNVVGGNGIFCRTQYSLSSTATTIAESTGCLLLLRDNINAGTALVLYENSSTPIIISQSGSTYTTGTPTGSQIKIASKAGNLGVAASMASGQSTLLNVCVISVDDG